MTTEITKALGLLWMSVVNIAAVRSFEIDLISYCMLIFYCKLVKRVCGYFAP